MAIIVYYFVFTQVLEKSEGFDNSTTGTKYLGSPQRFFFVIAIPIKIYCSLEWWEIRMPANNFLKGHKTKDLIFIPFIYLQGRSESFKALALGDFTVNMGQGLIQWQSLAFKKSVDVMGVKRQSAVLRPYNSAGEFNFHRGAGITIKKRKYRSNCFCFYSKTECKFCGGYCE